MPAPAQSLIEIPDAIARFWITKDSKIQLWMTLSGKVSMSGMPGTPAAPGGGAEDEYDLVEGES